MQAEINATNASVSTHYGVAVEAGSSPRSVGLMPKSTLAMCSATRIACAAMVSAGLTAADDGKKEASTTNRLSCSKARQNSFRAAVLGSLPKRTVPH